MTGNTTERARLLIGQNRYKEAEKELQKSLALDPNNTETLSLLSLCKLEEKNYEAAEELIRTAIGLMPGNPFLIYLYARILFEQDKYQEAEKNIREAILIDPVNDDFWGLLSAIYLDQKDWEKALEYANKGLEISPDNIVCLNLRSTALIKLDKKEESYSTIREALNYDPGNANTHSNLGWGLLEKGDHKKALEHFRKALQLDPESEYAKQGMVQALKARYFVYRIFLKYAFWISNMKSGAQWGVLIGFYAGSRLVRMVASSYPALQPFLMPIIFLYILFAISTWIIGPVTNLFLRLNIYGRYALSKREIQTSNFVGISLALGLSAFIAYLFIQEEILFMTGVFSVSMMIPLSSMLVPDKGSRRWMLIAYTSALALTGITGLVLFAAGNDASGTLASIYLVGVMIYQWVANAVIMK